MWQGDGVAVSNSDSDSVEIQGQGFVASINVADPANVHVVQRETLANDISEIHVTQEAVFAASYQGSNDKTAIQYIDISDPQGQISIRGSMTVPGWIINRFCMDSYGSSAIKCAGDYYKHTEYYVI